MYDVHDYEQNPEIFKSHYEPLITGEGQAFYNQPVTTSPYDGSQPYFVSEFGYGAFWDINKVETNNGQFSGSWGYGNAPKQKQSLARLRDWCPPLLDNPGICAFCYTQFTDVMQEMNGLFSYDRRWLSLI